MSSRKFAAMTGSLLARKGEASPSSEPYFAVPPVMREVAREVVRDVRQAPVEMLPPAEAVPARSAEAPHKIAMRLSEAQHLRLRVAARQFRPEAGHALNEGRGIRGVGRACKQLGDAILDSQGSE